MISWFKRIRKLSPLHGYNKWAETYHVEDNPIKNLSDEFIKNELPDLREKSILDAGCGTGRSCKIAIDQRAAIVKGIDLSPKMIDEARKNCPGAEFQCADLSVVEIKEKYDVVICGLVLGHIENVEPVLTKLVNSLKPGGSIILTDFHPYQTMMKAKRTFKDQMSGRTFEIKHNLHQLEGYFALLKHLGIEIKHTSAPSYKGNPVIFGIHGVAS